MAKKKKKSAPAPAPASAPAPAPAEQAPAEQAPAPASPPPEPVPEVSAAPPDVVEPEQQASGTAPEQAPDSGGEVDELKAEIARLREEVAELRAAGTDRSVDVSTKPSNPDISGLKERFSQLRQEQAAADEARARAWQELKLVVEQVGQLAASG